MLWALVGLVQRRALGGRSALPLAAILAVAAVVGVTGFALCSASAALEHAHHEAWEFVSEHAKTCRVFEPFVALLRLPLVAALVGTASILLLARTGGPRAPAATSTGARLAPVCVLLTGALAYGATRHEAHDAWSLPPDYPGESAAEGRALSLRPPAPSASATRAPSPSTATGTGRGRRSQPGGPSNLIRPGDHAALVSALTMSRARQEALLADFAAATPLAWAGPLLDAARAAGYRTIHAVVGKPRTFETRTLGRIEMAPQRCDVTIALDATFDGGASTPATATWGDLAR